MEKWNSLFLTHFFRSQIPPFVNARTVLQGLEPKDDDKKKVKTEMTEVSYSDCSSRFIYSQTV